MRRNKELRVKEDCIIINGELVPIDLSKTDLPDRCKLALAEMVTGQKYRLLKAASDS